jgi:hypothetical protein
VTTNARHYRFGPRDRSGWVLGLGAAQCVAIGSGVFASGFLLNAHLPAPVVLAPLLAAAAFAFGRWNGRPLPEVAPVALGWVTVRTTGRGRWFAELPRRTAQRTKSNELSLPPSLAGLAIVEAGDAAWTQRGRAAAAAVVRDLRENTVSATLRVRGREFALSERDAQEQQLQLWGDALAAFCGERGAVARFRWTESAAPVALDGQLHYLDERARGGAATPAVDTYRQLLEHAGPLSTKHDVLVTVTVDQRRLRRRPREARDRESAAEKALLDEVQLFSSRLEAAGLVVDLPLSPSETGEVMRSRLDPFGAARTLSPRRRSLAELAGYVTASNAGPLAVDIAWDHVRVDRAVHAAYVVAEWPRLEVPPNWMEPLLLHAGGVRTVAVLYEPVAPSRSQRQVDRETVKLASDEEQRTRTGFRINARHRRAQSEVLDREAELVAGYGELEFVGFVIVTAAEIESLDASCAEYEQAAAQAGLELRRLDGRHDLALACMLPIGRGIAPRRFAV